MLTGEVPVYFSPLATALPLVQANRLRALAVTTPQRLPALADPTVAELGYPGYEAGNWYGLLVPSKTPREAITTLRSAVVASLKSPAVSKRMDDLGYVASGNTPEEFAAFIQSEIRKLAEIIRRVGAKPE